jgi:predicted RNA-binding protein with RPS1 domain
LNFTKQESIEFTYTWNKIKKEAKELCHKQNWNSGWYPEGLHDITEAGLEFYDKVPEQWDDGDRIETRTLLWDDLLDYDESLRRAEDNIEAHKRQQEQVQLEWQRKNYESLKKKFEP